MQQAVSPFKEHQDWQEENHLTGKAGGTRTVSECEDGECSILILPRVLAIVIKHGAVVICSRNVQSAQYIKQFQTRLSVDIKRRVTLKGDCRYSDQYVKN